MKEDSEGFLYPEVDLTACVNCGLCVKVCPWLDPFDEVIPQNVLAVKNRNEEDRIASSSGGVFIALAKKILSDGGVVFGAVFDKSWNVRHVFAEDILGVKRMMGSKYLQSQIGHCYQDAEKFLKEGRKVLFSGTPCQITGLHKYLRKDYLNLFSVDFLCHGVPSPGVWRRYLQEISSSLKTSPEITDIDFRNKESGGWKKYSFVIRGISADKEDKNTVLLSDKFFENPYMQGFLANIYLRPSCYDCKCKNGVSHSDLTIADFWGVNHLMPDFDDNKGVSLVLINTSKGENLFCTLDMEIKYSLLESARQYNGAFMEKISVPPERKWFFRKLKINKFSSCLNLVLNPPLSIKIYNKFMSITNKLKL